MTKNHVNATEFHYSQRKCKLKLQMPQHTRTVIQECLKEKIENIKYLQ